MNKKHLYTALVGCAIAISSLPVQAEENPNKKSANTAFVCATQEGTPTMYAYTSGQVNLKPIMSWHSEYLLPKQSGKEICQQTANKLQASYQQKTAKYLKAESLEKKNLVCLVTEEDQNCADKASEKLFSVNPNYNAGCVLDNMKPLECKALKSRGNIYSFDDKPYQPVWWPWW